jgi:hypothetical protein
MNFSIDRDLLIIEPQVFLDVPLLSQQRVRVSDAQLDGTSLTSDLADFQAGQVDFGAVALLAGVPLEVVERVEAHELTVSQLRAATNDDPIPPVGIATGQAHELIVRTFAPQAGLVHDVLLRMLDLEPDDPTPGAAAEDAILSLNIMARLEALGTLERVYSAAAAIAGDSENLWRKAALYRERFASACRRATVLLDLDGDGRVDDRRSLGGIRLLRV